MFIEAFTILNNSSALQKALSEEIYIFSTKYTLVDNIIEAIICMGI